MITLLPPRWNHGPDICPVANLPHFPTKADAITYLLATHGEYLHLWQCSVCDGWHFWPKPRSPSGGTSGTTRPYQTPAHVRDLIRTTSKRPRIQLPEEEAADTPLWHTLNEADQVRARDAAQRRHDRHSANDTDQCYGRTAPRTFQEELDSLAAEITCANVLGIPWVEHSSVAQDRAGDIAPGVQVRQTNHRDGRLILHKPERDRDDHYFWLVRGRFPTFQVVGYCLAKDGRASADWEVNHKGRGCWYVRNHALKRLSDWRKRLNLLPPGL